MKKSLKADKALAEESSDSVFAMKQRSDAGALVLVGLFYGVSKLSLKMNLIYINYQIIEIICNI